MKFDRPDLIKKIAEDDCQISFGELFDYYFPGLFSYTLSIIKEKQQSEEIVYDVFCKVWLNRSALPSINNLTKYLYVSTKNTCLNFLKSRGFKNKLHTIFLEDTGDCFDSNFCVSEEDLISAENIKKINTAIQSLPPKCKLIFRLVKDENLKYADVANLLGISIKGVERQMTIATKKLTEILENDLSEYSSFFKKDFQKNK